jgi:Xaa-Pro aminopeptidase
LQKSTEILDESFDETWEALDEGVTETDLTRIMANAMRSRDAEDMSFIYVQSGTGDNEVPFRDPLPRTIRRGDVIYIDTGCIYKGYRSDYCRIVALKSATDRQREGYRKVYRVLDMCLQSVRAGATVAQIVEATEAAMSKEGFEKSKLPIRYGHSIGLEMPEPPSIAAGIANITIKPNTVLCLEPGALIDGRYFQLEEMVLVTESGCKLMSKKAEPELRIYN